MVIEHELVRSSKVGTIAVQLLSECATNLTALQDTYKLVPIPTVADISIASLSAISTKSDDQKNQARAKRARRF